MMQHGFLCMKGRQIAELEEIRHSSDYNDFYIASKEEVNEAIDTATEFVDMIGDYCRKEMGKWERNEV